MVITGIASPRPPGRALKARRIVARKAVGYRDVYPAIRGNVDGVGHPFIEISPTVVWAAVGVRATRGTFYPLHFKTVVADTGEGAGVAVAIRKIGVPTLVSPGKIFLPDRLGC